MKKVVVVIETIRLNKVLNTEQNSLINKILSGKELITKIVNECKKLSDSETTFSPSFESKDHGKSHKPMAFYINECARKSIFSEEKFSPNNKISYYCDENSYVIFRHIFCIYERISQQLTSNSTSLKVTVDKSQDIPKLVDSSESFVNLNNNLVHDNNLTTDSKTKLNYFTALFKAYVSRKFENPNTYEDLCRDVLGNESYFLINFDKQILNVRLQLKIKILDFEDVIICFEK